MRWAAPTAGSCGGPAPGLPLAGDLHFTLVVIEPLYHDCGEQRLGRRGGGRAPTS